MARTLMGLCFPVLSRETEQLLVNNNVFDSDSSLSLFPSCNVISGLVLTSDKEVNTNPVVHQAAVSASYLGKKVLVILAAGKWPGWPPGVHGMPASNADLSRNWTFLYPSSVQDIFDFTAEILDSDQIPDLIILQNVENTFSFNEQDSYESEKLKLVKLMAHLKEFLAQKHVNFKIQQDFELEQTCEDEKKIRATSSLADVSENNTENEKHSSMSQSGSGGLDESEVANAADRDDNNFETSESAKTARQPGDQVCEATATSETELNSVSETSVLADRSVTHLIDSPNIEDDKSECCSELLVFASMPRCYAEPSQLSQFFDEVWLLKRTGSDPANPEYWLDLVSPYHVFSINYFHRQDVYYLKSVKLKEKCQPEAENGDSSTFSCPVENENILPD